MPKMVILNVCGLMLMDEELIFVNITVLLIELKVQKGALAKPVPLILAQFVELVKIVNDPGNVT